MRDKIAANGTFIIVSVEESIQRNYLWLRLSLQLSLQYDALFLIHDEPSTDA